MAVTVSAPPAGQPARTESELALPAMTAGQVAVRTVAAAPTFALLAVGADKTGVRIRVYGSAAAREADQDRPVTESATSAAGLVVEYVTTDADVHALSPVPVGHCEVGESHMHLTVENDATPGDVTVTLLWLAMERETTA